MKKRLLKVAIALGVAIFACIAPPAYANELVPKVNVKVQISQSPSEVERLAWTAYGMSLASFLEERSVNTVPAGNYVPTYDAELFARFKLIGIWREITEKKALPFPYMDTLLKVDNAGFLRQYVWQFHNRPSWRSEDAPPNQEAFAVWASKNLIGHQPKTGAWLTVSSEK